MNPTSKHMGGDSGCGSSPRMEGITPAERYLKLLCDRTFLSLWSYPGLFRDQGVREQGIGKEICDLLVVFENHVVIFSDKDCDFPSTGGIKTDWGRWFRRAVFKSAKQAWGAERWMKSHPDRIFLDRECSQPFPIRLPHPEEASYHIVVVAHGCEERGRLEIGGNGSLIVNSTRTGRDHFTLDAEEGAPFEIGDLDPGKTFVHVLTDTSLDIVLKTVDTISDFTSYLTKKREFLRSGKSIFACSEQDLLAFYLKYLNDEGVHDFVVRSDASRVLIECDQWDDFQSRPERMAQLEANGISYVWDALIERFNSHILTDTQYFTTQAGIQHSEKIMRYLARECRTRRRSLAKSYCNTVERGRDGDRFTRYIVPGDPGAPHYALMSLKMPRWLSYEEYRSSRLELLRACCVCLKHKFPDAKDIVGIATEPLSEEENRSEDALYYDAREWSLEDEESAKQFSENFDILQGQPDLHHVREEEYPRVALATHSPAKMGLKLPKNPRNKPCPCGSGKKYKRCHGNL